jgi:hypothetical protein
MGNGDSSISLTGSWWSWWILEYISPSNDRNLVRVRRRRKVGRRGVPIPAILQPRAWSLRGELIVVYFDLVSRKQPSDR